MTDGHTARDRHLEALRARGSEAQDTVRSEVLSGVISAYLVRRPDGGTVVAAFRADRYNAEVGMAAECIDGGQAAEDQPPDPTQHATATAFTLSRLLGSASTDAPSAALGATPSAFEEIAETFLQDFRALYPSSSPDSEVSKEAGQIVVSPKLAESSLPNPYNSALHLSALAALWQSGYQVQEETLSVGDRLAQTVCVWFVQRARITSPDMQSRDKMPSDDTSVQALHLTLGTSNAYLTYLCVSALRDWAEVLEKRVTRDAIGAPGHPAAIGSDNSGLMSQLNVVGKALTIAYATSVADLSRQIASQSINRESLFDAMDIACTLATTALAGRAPGVSLVDEYWRGLLKEAVACLSQGYLLPDGSFAPKGGAFTNENKYNIVLSSAEIGDILFSAVRDFDVDQLMSYDPLIAAIIRRREGRRGWGIAAPAAHARHVFATASALALLRRFDTAVTGVLAASAATELGVPGFSADPKTEAIDVGAVWHVIERHTIEPLRVGRWDRADLSLVLHGPPGTAKTTIAKKIAQSLRWPLLELDQGAFLKRGAAQLEAEAERIFGLVQDLRNTVVLFDEIEGMVGGRGPGSSENSRFLTTSMLPRIHHLRDHGQVVFIIATNYKDKLDSAATRPGRIDRILSVGLPSVAQRAAMVRGLVAQHDPMGLLRLDELLSKPEIETLLADQDWTYKYLELLVRRCATHRSWAGVGTPLGDDCLIFAKKEVKDLRDRFVTEQESWSKGMKNGDQA